MKRAAILAWALAFAAPLASFGADPPRVREASGGSAPLVAITGVTVHTGTGPILEDAVVLLEGGVVREVGKGLAVPRGAIVTARRGAVVTAGLVEPLSSLGLVEVDLEDTTHDDKADGSQPIHAGFRAIDGFNPASRVLAVARSEGLTAAGIVPHGGLVTGQSAWVDLAGASVEEAAVRAPLALDVDLREGGQANAIHRLREALDDAREFTKRRAAWERNQSRGFALSRLDLEALAQSLDGKLPVVFHVDRAAGILAALEVAREFSLRPIIAGGAEAWQVKQALAAAKVPVIVEPFLAGPVSFDRLGARDDNAALLHAAGVPIALTSGETHNARKLRQAAGNAVRAGLPHEAAIQAITRGPAEAFGLDGRVGTLEAGKAANLVVWSGDPLEIGTRVLSVYVRGREVELRSRQTELFEKYKELH